MKKQNNSWFGELRNLFGIFTILLITLCTLSFLFPNWGWKVPWWLKDVYLRILIGMIILKEGLRWLGHKRGRKIMKGRIYVITWLTLICILGILSTFWKERFSKYPTDLVDIVTTSIFAWVFSILSKVAYKKPKIKKLVNRFTDDSKEEN